MKHETKGSDMIDYDQEFDRGKNTKLNLDMHEELDSSHKKKENDLLGAWKETKFAFFNIWPIMKQHSLLA